VIFARRRRIVVLLDCGDTLVDEGTEVKDERGATLRAEMIPGAERALRRLHRRGYTLALVADGFVDTFRNVLMPRGLWELFSARAISEEVGVDKPESAMFTRALDDLRLGSEDYWRVVMVGNNLERDIAGARRLGLGTIWVNWAPRRRKLAEHPDERPDYTIAGPSELPALIARLEREAARAERKKGADRDRL
jgi:FMN phosphatase YigB (HAD superfamily)